MASTNNFNKYLSLLLLFGLFLTLAPKQFLKGHEGHHAKICNDLKKHFDQPEHDCAFCDVILSSSLSEQPDSAINQISTYSSEMFFPYLVIFSLPSKHSFFLRGPPYRFHIGL